jgi:hypothetical protein
MAMEGMPLTDKDKERLKLVLRGEVIADEMVRRLVAKHIGKIAKLIRRILWHNNARNRAVDFAAICTRRYGSHVP